MDRANCGLKDQCRENDTMMARFADEIRQMDVEVERKRREQEAADAENRRLSSDLEELKYLQSKYDQMKITLEEESARRNNAEAEADRVR